MSILQDRVLEYLNKHRESITSYKLAKELDAEPIKVDKVFASLGLKGLIRKETGTRFSTYSINLDENGDIDWPDEYKAVRSVLSKSKEPVSMLEISKKSGIDRRRVAVILNNLCILGYADYKTRIVSIKKECLYFE